MASNDDRVIQFPHLLPPFSTSHALSFCPSLSLRLSLRLVKSLFIFVSLASLSRRDFLGSLARQSPSTVLHSWCYFVIALCLPLLPSIPSVLLLHWRVQALAGMIAEPAFLSEYTIFALDHSKRPKTAQVASVVSCSHSLLPPPSSYPSPVLLPSTSSLPSLHLCASSGE